MPGVAPAGTVTVTFVSAVGPDRVTDAGDAVQVVFGGPPAQPIATGPVNPPCPVTVILYVALRPETLCDVGDAEMLKSMARTRTPADVLPLRELLPL